MFWFYILKLQDAHIRRLLFTVLRESNILELKGFSFPRVFYSGKRYVSISHLKFKSKIFKSSMFGKNLCFITLKVSEVTRTMKKIFFNKL